MYFGMLFMIAIGLHYLISYNELEDKKDIVIVRFFSSLIVFFIISIWFFMSVFPHSFNNLKNAGYPNIKM
jgi:uncharacterized membrane protein YfhO